jgi:Xaa-Pro dipeptidase
MLMPDVSRRGCMSAGLAMSAALAASASLSATANAPASTVAAPAPIGRPERLARLARAQGRMRALGISALLVEPGASLDYFTGVQWRRSERLTAAIIPANGAPTIVTPFFERPSVAETLSVPADLLVWQEDADPLALVADVLRAHRADRGLVGIEESVRWFASDGLRARLPAARLVSANPVIRALRMIKTAPEIALMQQAADLTVAALRQTHAEVTMGMTASAIGARFEQHFAALGGTDPWSLVLIDAAAALPHGSGKPQAVGRGSIVLMDCGGAFHGYQADISRTFVFGADPTADQRRVWTQVRQGQAIALAAATIGTPAGRVDDAVRAQYAAWGYGPGYRLPGLSHRTGHGIGMEGHEPVNLVHGEAALLAPGMCFSNEPGLYLPGRFGVRIEDCFHMTDAGPRWFSRPPPSIDQPFA